MASARASLIRRNINFLLSPYKAAADADATVVRLKEARDKASTNYSNARKPFFEPMSKDAVYQGGPAKSVAVAALTAELKAEQGKVATAKQTFQTIVAEASAAPSQ